MMMSVKKWGQCGPASAAAVVRARKRLQKKKKKKNKREMKQIAVRIERVKREMAEIGKEQRSIREGQQEVRLKCEALASQCRHLREETDLILEQSAATQRRLALMFAILRARETHDFHTADRLAALLRKAA